MLLYSRMKQTNGLLRSTLAREEIGSLACITTSDSLFCVLPRSYEVYQVSDRIAVGVDRVRVLINLVVLGRSKDPNVDPTFWQGLLVGRKSGRWFEYSLTLKGWERLAYFWSKFGYFVENQQMLGTERELARLRFRVWESFTADLNKLKSPPKKTSRFHALFPRPMALPQDKFLIDVLFANAPVTRAPPSQGHRSAEQLLVALATLKGIRLIPMRPASGVANNRTQLGEKVKIYPDVP
jgi:hypothetical protein